MKYLLNVGRRSQNVKIARKITNVLGKERKKKIRMGSLEGSCERNCFPTLGSPSNGGRSAGTERELQGLGGEYSSWFVARTERDQYREPVPLPWYLIVCGGAEC